MSPTRIANLLATAALVCAIALAVWGCSSPTDDGEDDDHLYPLRSSPDSLIAKFVRAYENMDVEAYLDCFADSMVFHLCPTDVEENPELEPGYWPKAVEDSIHQGMFGDSERAADSISLSLTTTEIETLRVAGFRPRVTGWRYREAVDLRVYLHDEWVYWARTPSVFVISVDPGESGPSGELLYEIGEWRELDEWYASERREHTSWGLIKSLYLVRDRPAPAGPASH